MQNKSRLVNHLLPHVAKRDVGDRGRQSIERPCSDLERPKRRYAALEVKLGHRVIIWSALFSGAPFGRTPCTTHRKFVTPRRFRSPVQRASRLRSPYGRSLTQKRASNAVLAIAAGGLAAGTLDLTQAMILFGKDIPLAIAAGLLGPRAFQGGAGTYILGVLLHFFIACSAAAIYFAVSRKLGFLTEHPLVCGLFFGAAVELVMRLIVLPLSALHAMGPYTIATWFWGCWCTWSLSGCRFLSACGGSPGCPSLR